MYRALLTIVIVILGLAAPAQEMSLRSSLLSAGGNAEGSSIGFSRWGLGQVHLITLPGDASAKDKLKDGDLSLQDWNVRIFPNPVKDFLYLAFELPEAKELFLKITDVGGRIVYIQEARTYINGSIVDLDLSGYNPALYLLQISSQDLRSQKIYPIQKIKVSF